ncbi:MAG: dihydroorotase [bacterium]|nr:dihydroorotase [bacterium]
MTELTITKPDDFHLHLRQGDLMKQLVPLTAESFARALVMPNLQPPVVSASDLKSYQKDLAAVGSDLQLLMTFKLMPSTTPQMVAELRQAGAVAGKLYPQGVSVNSEDGVTDVEALYSVFDAMQEQNLVLCIHGEMPGVGEMEAETAFLPTLQALHTNFPRLRIVLEHVSTRAGVEMIKSLSATVGATVTVHHLLLTIDDVRHDHHINPHHYCRPVCKSEVDRKILLETVLSGHPQFFFGSDSAPHLKATKEVSTGEPSRGVFSTPVALPLLAQLFEEYDQLSRLEAFVAQLGADFYQLPKNKDSITLQRSPWTVPQEYFGVVPLWAGKTLEWKI